MFRRPLPLADVAYADLREWSDSGDRLSARCLCCSDETALRPAPLVARHGWRQPFRKAVREITCRACGGATMIVRDAPEQIRGAA